MNSKTFLICTTLLHLLAINKDQLYNLLITSATLASVLYHNDEQNKIISIIDHTIAIIWVIVDMYYLFPTVFLNILTFIICKLAGEKYHGYWHIFNAGKSIIVSYLIFTYYING